MGSIFGQNRPILAGTLILPIFAIILPRQTGTAAMFRILIAACCLWGAFNVWTAVDCLQSGGELSPFYWPPVAQCTKP